jgi:ribosome-associated protein
LATKKLDERPKLKSSHRGEPKSPAKKAAKPFAGRAAPKAAGKAPAKPTVAKPALRSPLRSQPIPDSQGPVSKRKTKTIGDSIASDEARQMALQIVGAALEKKALGLEVLDVAGRVDYADFLVLMTGRSDRQVAALAQGIEDALRKAGRRALAVEGLPTASWVLMDFGDVVVHVFQESARSLYDLEGLWMDARRLPLPSEA